MFETHAQKAKAKGQPYATIRKDVIRRVILSGRYKKLVCNYRYTDDYAWDAENNFGKGELTREEAVKVAETWLKSGKGYDTRCYISVDEPNIVCIIPYRNLSYSLYV